jgi:hypothetical protein
MIVRNASAVDKATCRFVSTTESSATVFAVGSLGAPGPRRGGDDRLIHGQRRVDLILWGDHGVLKLDAPIQRRREDAAVHLEQRRGARLSD